MDIKFGCNAEKGGQTAILNGKIYQEEKPEAVGGFSRKIFFIDYFVVKLDDSHLRFNQSKNEFDLWKKIDEKDKKYFAEVVGGGAVNEYCFWVAQRFIEINLHALIPRKVQELVDTLKEKYKLSDIDSKLAGRNWALIDDTPVIYDYGFLKDYGFIKED